MKNIHCIVVDDEPYARSLIKGYVEKTPGLELLDTFSHPVKALEFIRNHSPDLLFLDIEMPEVDGMKLAELLDDSPAIIFTTAYSEYAVESYEKNALDYLLKPITYGRFLKSIEKYKSIKDKKITRVDKMKSDKIFLKSESTFIGLSYDDIYYIQGLGDYVTFNTTEGKVIVYHTFKKLVDLLPEQFMRIHYSYIVNFEHIKKAGKNEVLLLNKKIPVSKSYKKRVMERIEGRLL